MKHSSAGPSVDRPRVILLPGLGADARAFAPQRLEFPELESPPWIEPEPGESLADFGRRMAAVVNAKPPYVLGGASFGGMVALEVARHLRPPPQEILLIASCHSGRALSAPLRAGGRVMPLLPAWLAKRFYAAVPLTIAMREHLDARERELLRDMLDQTSDRLIRWASAAIVQWPGPRDLPAPVYHIHGQQDPIIPLRRVFPDVVVPGAGHAVNATRAGEVNRLLRERIEHGRRAYAQTVGVCDS